MLYAQYLISMDCKGTMHNNILTKLFFLDILLCMEKSVALKIEIFIAVIYHI